MRRQRGLYKRGNIWWIGIKGTDGKPYCKSTGTGDIRQAEEILDRKKKELPKDKLQEIKEYTFAELAGEYLKWAEPRRRSYRDKKYRMEHLLRWFGGNRPLSAFDTMLIEQYQTEKLKVNKPATVNRTLALLKHTFTMAVKWKMVSRSVLMDVRQVKPESENNRRLRYLSAEECLALVDACSPHLRPIVITALYTGMRRGEILGLKWSQIDLRHGFILLDKTKNGKRKEIPINTTLRQVFESIPHGPESEYVFVDRNGRPYKSVNNSFPTACKRAGIQDFHFHDLRHTFASHLAMAGVDIKTIQELLGHETLTMTIRYAHLAPGYRVNAVKVLEGKLGISEDKTSSVFYNPSTISG